MTVDAADVVVRMSSGAVSASAICPVRAGNNMAFFVVLPLEVSDTSVPHALRFDLQAKQDRLLTFPCVLAAAATLMLAACDADHPESQVAPPVVTAIDPSIAAVEHALPPLILEGRAEAQLSLTEWMAALDIPSLGLAVIEGGEVAWVRGYSSKHRSGLAADTRFQSGSISKPLTTLALLHHVERRRFDLDAPVNDYLGDWQLRDADGNTDHGVSLRQHGESDAVISQAMTREMLTEALDGHGLSWVLHLGENGALPGFSHSGGTAGYRAHIRMLPGTGQGIVVMTNSDNGQLLFSPILHAVSQVYGWPDPPAREVPRHVAVRVLAAQGLIDIDVPVELLERYVGRYELEPGFVFDVQRDDGRLSVQLGEQPRLLVFPESRDTFYYREVNAQLTFVMEQSGAVTGLVLTQHGRQLEAPRIE